MSQTTVGPHRGHAAGDSDIEKAASQLVSDVKYKVKKEMGPNTNLNPAQVAQKYIQKLNSSPAPSAVKAIARKKLGGLKEEYAIDDLVRNSLGNALSKVFIEGVEKKEDIQEKTNSQGERVFHIRVTDKKTGNTYTRDATRSKIAELRANPNISSVEMTEYNKDSKEESDKGAKTSRVKSGKGLDPVGREDADVNNNGVKNDKSDKYLLKRRAAVGSAIQNRKTVSASYEAEGELIGEQKKKSKTKGDTITGEGVNNSRHINVKPTMEQSEPTVAAKNPEDEDKQKIKLRQKQVQFALNRQRQTMQLQRSGRLPLNYSEDNNPEGDDIQEVAPPGFEGTVKAMKNYPELSQGKTSEGKDKNIYALAWFMKNKGYKSHKTKSGSDKEVQKSHYEPQGQVIGEEESDRVNDRRLMGGGVGAGRGSSRTSNGPSKPVDPKKHAETTKTAMDLVRQSIIAKHGKGALM
jgi:hypothetical protein